MELSSGELIKYLKLHFKIYPKPDLKTLAQDLNIKVHQYIINQDGYITRIEFTELSSGAIIKW